eukprot:TRINITY_DN47785_c0_g1_i2.p1 TRINITY_DN47785_c0_g1~~TRINITY_DN47785_c0_g1_i2.p1  ORF type:complete len:279 (-),score=54.99 TRINITY_DN47785_c0_g1_i2:465-1301(-)
MAAAAEGLVAICRDDAKRRQERCFYKKDVEVIADDKGACSLVATADVAAGTEVLVEQMLLFDKLPDYFHPRKAGEAPWFLIGIPFCLLPQQLADMLNVTSFLRFALNICEPQEQLFAVGSAINHSCCPNAVRISREDGLTATVTCRKIASGEEVTLSYMDALTELDLPHRLRRIVLFFRYGFYCRCKYCCGLPRKEGAEFLAGWKAAAQQKPADAIKSRMPTLVQQGAADPNYKAHYETVSKEDSKTHWAPYSRVLSVGPSIPVVIFVPLMFWLASQL